MQRPGARVLFRCFIVAFLCVSGCATVERDVETPPARPNPAPSAEPRAEGALSDATRRAIVEMTRSFIVDLIEGDVDGLATAVAFPLSYRAKGPTCADATSRAELDAWAACAVSRLPPRLLEREGLANLEITVWGPRNELPEPAKSDFAGARDDAVFASGSYHASPFMMAVILEFRRQPSLAVTGISLDLVRQD